MQKVFEKIIEKLESLENVFIKGNSHNVAAGISRAIEIVKQEAAEYNNDQINRLAMMYAKNIVLYGVDITKIWDTATQQTDALNQAYILGRQDERDRFEQYTNGWIPCSERLPGNISTVILQVEEIEKPTFGWYGNMNGWRLTEKDFVELKDFTVIAWQPMPESYQPKGE